MLQDNVKGSAGNAEKVATEGLKVRDDGAAFFSTVSSPCEVDDAVWDRKIFLEAPFVTCTKAGGMVCVR